MPFSSCQVWESTLSSARHNPRVGRRHVVELDRGAVRKNDPLPDQQRAPLPESDDAVIAADQPRPLRDQDGSPGRAVADILGDLGKDRSGKIGIEPGDQARRNDCPGAQRPGRRRRVERVRIDRLALPQRANRSCAAGPPETARRRRRVPESAAGSAAGLRPVPAAGAARRLSELDDQPLPLRAACGAASAARARAARQLPARRSSAASGAWRRCAAAQAALLLEDRRAQDRRAAAARAAARRHSLRARWRARRARPSQPARRRRRDSRPCGSSAARARARKWRRRCRNGAGDPDDQARAGSGPPAAARPRSTSVSGSSLGSGGRAARWASLMTRSSAAALCRSSRTIRTTCWCLPPSRSSAAENSRSTT